MWSNFPNTKISFTFCQCLMSHASVDTGWNSYSAFRDFLLVPPQRFPAPPISFFPLCSDPELILSLSRVHIFSHGICHLHGLGLETAFCPVITAFAVQDFLITQFFWLLWKWQESSHFGQQFGLTLPRNDNMVSLLWDLVLPSLLPYWASVHPERGFLLPAVSCEKDVSGML